MEISAHGDQAETGLLRANDRLVVHIMVADIEITGAISPALMAETALDDAGQLGPGVGMFKHTCPRSGPKQKRARIARSGQNDRLHFHARCHATLLAEPAAVQD